MSSHSKNDDRGGPSPLPTTWSDLTNTNNSTSWNYANHLFPPLTASSHKGSHGRIAIIGGSEKYTGAPFYAAQAALTAGVDLATVFCAEEASVPIKCYSPELMVQGLYSVETFDALLAEEEGLLEERERCKQSSGLLTGDMNESELLAKAKQVEENLHSLREKKENFVGRIVDTVTSMFPALHALCIGPGLGRHPLVFSAVSDVIQKAIESNLNLVLDADVLFMLSLEEYRDLFEMLRCYDRCVMTPNLMEMRRLDKAGTGGLAAADIRKNDDSYIVVQKGSVDAIRTSCRTMLCEEEGGLKRSGGLGDVLAGTITAFMAWNNILERDRPDDCIESMGPNERALASWAACCAVKKGTKLGFQKKKRAMSAMDVIREMGDVLESMEGKLSQTQQPKSS